MSDSEYENNKVNKNLSLHNHKTRIPDNESYSNYIFSVFFYSIKILYLKYNNINLKK